MNKAIDVPKPTTGAKADRKDRKYQFTKIYSIEIFKSLPFRNLKQ